MKKIHAAIWRPCRWGRQAPLHLAQTPLIRLCQSPLTTTIAHRPTSTSPEWSRTASSARSGMAASLLLLLNKASSGPTADSVVFIRDCRPRCRGVSITLPDAGKRFMGMQVVNQDQYTTATITAWVLTPSLESMVGTRYAIVVVRFFVDFSNEEDIRQVHACKMRIRFDPEKRARHV